MKRRRRNPSGGVPVDRRRRFVLTIDRGKKRLFYVGRRKFATARKGQPVKTFSSLSRADAIGRAMRRRYSVLKSYAMFIRPA
jgi:hypothetical protein